MTKRCRHEYETKVGYSDDVICQKCQTIWHISEYMSWSAVDLMHHAPLFIRKEVLKRQVENSENVY